MLVPRVLRSHWHGLSLRKDHLTHDRLNIFLLIAGFDPGNKLTYESFGARLPRLEAMSALLPSVHRILGSATAEMIGSYAIDPSAPVVGPQVWASPQYFRLSTSFPAPFPARQKLVILVGIWQ